MIGQAVWIYDVNRRVYRRDENGRSIGGPIWRDHWLPCKVVGETKVSWITEYGRKVPKKGGREFALSAEELDRLVFVNDNAYPISEKVRRLAYEDLKRVADIIGYVANN